jgi:hypothetical protein
MTDIKRRPGPERDHCPNAGAAAREVGFLGFGYYPRSGFIHVDLGPARQCDERFPVKVTAFAQGVAKLGAAGVEVAQQVLAET